MRSSLRTTSKNILPSWSPDSRFILYYTVGGPTQSDLIVLPLSGDRKPVPFLKTSFNERGGQFSPDGRWVAYYFR